MANSDRAAAVAMNFTLQDHSFLGPNPFHMRRKLMSKYNEDFSFKNGIGMYTNVDEAKRDPLWPSEEAIDEYNRRYNLALLEEMKKKVTYEEYLAWGNDLGEARSCEFRNGQCELFCEKFMECIGD